MQFGGSEGMQRSFASLRMTEFFQNDRSFGFSNYQLQITNYK
jgi:hypothetical protein